MRLNFPRGAYRVTLYKAPNPEPAGARSVDAILITSDPSELSSPRLPRYPMLDEWRRDNHVYFRFRNLSKELRCELEPLESPDPDFYSPQYRDGIA